MIDEQKKKKRFVRFFVFLNIILYLSPIIFVIHYELRYASNMGMPSCFDIFNSEGCGIIGEDGKHFFVGKYNGTYVFPNNESKNKSLINKRDDYFPKDLGKPQKWYFDTLYLSINNNFYYGITYNGEDNLWYYSICSFAIGTSNSKSIYNVKNDLKQIRAVGGFNEYVYLCDGDKALKVNVLSKECEKEILNVSYEIIKYNYFSRRFYKDYFREVYNIDELKLYEDEIEYSLNEAYFGEYYDPLKTYNFVPIYQIDLGRKMRIIVFEKNAKWSYSIFDRNKFKVIFLCDLRNAKATFYGSFDIETSDYDYYPMLVI